MTVGFLSFMYNRNSSDYYDILYPKCNGGYRVIKAGNWWINRNTPVGEPAELWERKPYGGQKLLDTEKMKKVTEEDL